MSINLLTLLRRQQFFDKLPNRLRVQLLIYLIESVRQQFLDYTFQAIPLFSDLYPKKRKIYGWEKQILEYDYFNKNS